MALKQWWSKRNFIQKWIIKGIIAFAVFPLVFELYIIFNNPNMLYENGSLKCQDIVNPPQPCSATAFIINAVIMIFLLEFSFFFMFGIFLVAYIILGIVINHFRSKKK
jgi:hypothetical protein